MFCPFPYHLMIVTPNAEAANSLIQRAMDYRDSHEPRLPGLHVSDLVTCLIKSWHRKHGWDEPENDLRVKLMFLLGHGLHSQFEFGQIEEKVILQLGQHEAHGTIDLVDAIVYDDDLQDLPTEVKSTRKSSKKDLSDNPHYVEQCASYCLAKGVTRGRVVVAHTMGDYKGPLPDLRVYDIEFSPEDLAEWQAELTWRAGLVLSETPPAPEDFELTHYSWECNYCPLKDNLCEGGPGKTFGYFVDNATPEWLIGN